MIQRLLSYIRSLNPHISKEDVLKEIRSAREELDEFTIPSYEAALELVARREFKSKPIKDFERRFQAEIHSRKRGNFVEVTNAILKQTQKNLEKLEKIVDKSYNENIATNALSYSRAQVLRLSESANFLSRYARAILIYTLLKETKFARDDKSLSYDFTPAHARWIEANQENFFIVLRAFNRDERELESMIEEIPDIEVNETNAEAVASQVGQRRLDPFSVSHLNARTLNPIYYIRLPITEFRVARYEAAKEERRMLEYQIRDMRKALEDEHDPKLEQALEYQIDRLEKLNAKIARFEEEVSDAA